jgi:hypothetical protein
MPSDCPMPPMAEGASAGPGVGGGVTVTKQETVGPYQTAQLHATDPNALNNWLAQNGYVIPADIQPIIDAYVAEHFDFLALKLVPGQGVEMMRPVRVTTLGASLAMPLRMVSAGTGANVGITLWVVAEGRYEPQNFSSFTIAADELSWDWSTYSSNLAVLRQQKTDASGGRAWEIESSMSFTQPNIQSYVQNGYCAPYYGAGTVAGSAGQAGVGQPESRPLHALADRTTTIRSTQAPTPLARPRSRSSKTISTRCSPASRGTRASRACTRRSHTPHSGSTWFSKRQRINRRSPLFGR